MEKKVRKKTDIVENGGKVLINFGQILFASLFLGGVIQGNIPPYLMIIVGGITALLCVFVGLVLSAKEKKDKED